MTELQRSEMTKVLFRAQDAILDAFNIACRTGDLDLAADLRKQRITIGDKIAKINGGAVKMTRLDMFGARG